MIEYFYNLDTLHHFLNKTVQLAHCRLLMIKIIFRLFSAVLDKQVHRQKCDHNDTGKLPVKGENNDNRTGDHYGTLNQRCKAVV